MPSHVLLRKLCSSLIFLILWLVEQNSTAVKEICDIIAYLNLIANLSDNISFERIINEPKRGIGPGTVEKIRDFANMQEMSMLDASANIMLSGIRERQPNLSGILPI